MYITLTIQSVREWRGSNLANAEVLVRGFDDKPMAQVVVGTNLTLDAAEKCSEDCAKELAALLTKTAEEWLGKYPRAKDNMTPELLAILAWVCRKQLGIVEPQPTLVDEPAVQLTASDVCGADTTSVHQLWWSKSGRFINDDVAVGYVRLPRFLSLNEITAENYKFSCLSTSVTSQFHKNWNLVLPLSTAPLEHRVNIMPHLFIKTA